MALYCIYLPSNKEVQNDCVYLFFNIENENHTARKYIDSNGRVNFYINKEHFVSIKKGELLCATKMNDNDLIDIEEFLDMANQKQRKLIKEEEKKGVIKILSSDTVFDCIFIYEKKDNDEWVKYFVKWIDEIID